MNRRFLAIGIAMLLLSAAYIAFTVGFLFFHWGGQYRYELFYFPSPVAYTLESLTTTGRMVSLLAPVLTVSILIVSAAAFQLPSPGVLSTDEQRQASLQGSPLLKPYLAGVVAAPASGGAIPEGKSGVPHAFGRRDYLSRLFPYEGNDCAPAQGLGRTRFVVVAEGEQTTIASCSGSGLLTTT